MLAVPVAEVTPAVTTPVHVSPTFTTYRSRSPSFQESAKSPEAPEGILSEEDYPIPTVQEEEMAEGLSAAMSAGMSFQDPFGASNPTRSELEEMTVLQGSRCPSGRSKAMKTCRREDGLNP